MTVQTYVNILLGALLMGDLIAALFFVRYWRITGDRFFLFFAASFLGAAVSRILVDQHIPPFGMESVGYAIRFIQYLLIVIAIIDKNRLVVKSSAALVSRR